MLKTPPLLVLSTAEQTERAPCGVPEASAPSTREESVCIITSYNSEDKSGTILLNASKPPPPQHIHTHTHMPPIPPFDTDKKENDNIRQNVFICVASLKTQICAYA